MKILYAALRHDPRNPDLASGVDYNFHSSFVRENFQIKIVGPFTVQPPIIERSLKKLYEKVTGKKYIKWDFATLWRASRELEHVEAQWKPDIVFTIYPLPIAFYKGKAPCVFNTDTTFQGWQNGGAGYGTMALQALNWIEHSAIKRSAKLIVFSEWCRQEVMLRHDTDRSKIEMIPMPAGLLIHHSSIGFSKKQRYTKELSTPVRLLLVGRDYFRKGVDIAIEIVNLLNVRGVFAELKVICNEQKPRIPNVQFVGPFRKSVPSELSEYTKLYQWAHFLIHPARFDPSPIVPAEAAAFGTPTLTNDTGGISTSVKDGVSGIVLPKHSLAEKYVEQIIAFINEPERYYRLCETTRRRYDEELNWEVAGKKVCCILDEVVQEARS